MLDLAAGFADRGHRVAHQKIDAGCFAELDQLACEAVGIARFVFSGVCGAGQARPHMRQSGLDLDSLVSRDHQPLATEGAHLFARLQRAFELFLVGVEMQDALRALVVSDAGLAPQRLQHVAAVGAEPHDLFDVVSGARWRAFAQELQTPQPLAHVGANAKEQWRVFLA